MEKKYSLGLDISKEGFQVFFLGLGKKGKPQVLGSKKFKNSQQGFVALLDWLWIRLSKTDGVLEEVHAVLETTGSYHESLTYFLFDAGLQVHLVMAYRAKRYMESIGMKSKNDALDAKGLARMGWDLSLPVWEAPPKSLRELRSLTRQLEQLKKEKTRFLNQKEAANHSVDIHPMVIDNYDQMISHLQGIIHQVEKSIKKLVKTDPLLKAQWQHVAPIKGVAEITFAVIVSETLGFDQFKNQKQLTSYAGYDVVENQSGKRAGKTKISKKGNAHIRRILHMAALAVVRHKVSPFYQLYKRIFKRSEIKMVAYVAVQRKLLMMLYTLWKKDQDFDPHFGVKEVDIEGAIKKQPSPEVLAALDEWMENNPPILLWLSQKYEKEKT